VANVNGAVDAGLQGHLFVSVAALSDELQRRGVT
jgi:putative hydrolase of the HAD superfamily